MTVEEYLARGGKITIVKPAIAEGARFHSECSIPVISAEPIRQKTWKEGVSEIFARGRANRSKTPNRGAQLASQRAEARREHIRAMVAAGATREDIARSEGVSPARARELMTAAGIPAPQKTGPVKKPVDVAEVRRRRDAGERYEDIAKAMKISCRLISRALKESSNA